jgi:arginase
MAHEVELIVVPYDSAQCEARMGAGPRALVGRGIAERLLSAGLAAHITEVEPTGEFRAEIATAVDLQCGVRRAIERAVRAGRRAITLSGNCNTGVVGSLAAHGDGEVGLVWFDAHSDAETPDSTTSGFLDGMGLAMALRCCFGPLLDRVGDWSLDGARTALVGAREISPAADALLRSQGVTIVAPEQARTGSLEGLFERFREAGMERVHVHVDLDVLDSERVGPANSYALPDGVTAEQLQRLLSAILERFELASASVASYDPAVDRSGKVAAAGLDVVALLAAA